MLEVAGSVVTTLTGGSHGARIPRVTQDIPVEIDARSLDQ